MPGASSSAVHAVVIEDGAGYVHELVLRRFTDAEWLACEPDLAAREAEALALLDATPLATPRIAVDATGEECDVPAVLMTRLPGRPQDAPDDIGGFITRLAEPLPIIHETPLPTRAAIPDYRPYYLDAARRGELRPPTGTRDPAMWERAIEVHFGPPPAGLEVFLHRDYHPGNVLWRRGRVSGIVDWVNASRGRADADLGHCRVEPRPRSRRRRRRSLPGGPPRAHRRGRLPPVLGRQVVRQPNDTGGRPSHSRWTVGRLGEEPPHRGLL